MHELCTRSFLGLCAVNTLELTYGLHCIYTLYALVNDVIEQRRVRCTQGLDLLLGDQLMKENTSAVLYGTYFISLESRRQVGAIFFVLLFYTGQGGLH
jgi:hypothetical protein